MTRIADGPVWCERCRRWFDAVAPFVLHLAGCSRRAKTRRLRA